MRLSTVVVAALLAVPSTALAEDFSDAHRRTLRGHTFMMPASFESAFIQTTFVNRTSARRASTSNVPVGAALRDVETLGVREAAGFALAVGEHVEVGIDSFAQFLVGTTGRSLATQGALYAYGVAATAGFRILRIEESGTQLTARVEMFGVQGGGQLAIGPFIQAVRTNGVRSVPELIGNFGNLLTVPVSWWGFAGSINLAQAFGDTFSLQASFRLDVKRFSQSPFVPGQGRIDISSTGVLPQVGVAFGVNPPAFPVSFLAEYRAAAQDDDDPTSLPHHLIALGIYYSARKDLQLGPVLAGEFGLPPVQGIDANGARVGSETGTAWSGQGMMQYFW